MSDYSAEIWQRSGGIGRWGLRWLPGGVAGLATGGMAADRGGYFPTAWGWAVVPLCWVVVMALFVRDRVSLSRLELAFLAALFAIPCWYALSIRWSNDVPQTILEVERTLLYPSGVLAVVLVTRSATVRALLAGVLVAITAICWYALGTRMFPTRVPTFDVISTYRLTGPITYWNALGIFAAVGALVAAALATSGRRIVARSLAAATLPVLIPTMYLTFSRGAWIAMAIGLIGAVWLAPRRLPLVTAVLALAPAPALAVVIASRSKALTRLQESLDRAQHDGHRMTVIVLALVIVSGLVGAGLAVAERRLRIPARVRLAYTSVIGLVIVGIVAAALVRFGDPVTIVRDGWNSFTGPPVQVSGTTNLNSRLFSLSSNGRMDIWKQAVDAYAANPVTGIGGGSFEQWWEMHRTSSFNLVNAHSLYLEALAELGPVGLLLVLAAIGLPLAAAVRNRHHPLVPLLFGAFLAFAFHAGIDWDWQVTGVTLGALLVGVSLLALARGENPRPRGGWFRWPTLAVALVVGAFSLFGLVGNRYVARTGGATAAIARDAADRADAWAPWSTLGLARLGEVQRRAGNTKAARLSYLAAIERSRSDYLLWLNLALSSTGPERTAAAREALRLNPLAPEINSLRPFLGLPPLPGQATPSPPAPPAATTPGTATAGTARAPAATTTTTTATITAQ